MLAKKPTENTEACRLYLRGRHPFAKSTRAGCFRLAILLP
jgi:hypothetical protein